jgi:glycosyltransferase involved in cell wall biosynthesis
VEFAGRIDREALRVRLDAANCLVLPSRSEGLPRVILEAMARARPVVATAVGGIPELVDDPCTGRLVPPDDAPALAGALVAVLGDPHHAAQAGAQARADALARDPEQEFEAGTAALGAWLRNRRP